MTALEKHILSRERAIVETLNFVIEDLAREYAKRSLRDPFHAGDFFKYNHGFSDLVDRILYQLKNDVVNQIKSGTYDAWMIANAKNDVLVKSYIKGLKVPDGLLASMNNVNLDALDAFINGKRSGRTLSERVWRLSRQVKREINLYLGSGIAQGKPAAKLATDMKKFLKNPDAFYRRVRDKAGNLVLSEAAKKYHPGPGVYRSAYKNALRLVRTENNMAFLRADYERQKQLPFIRGVEIRLSTSHAVYDICDHMQGRYPQGFVFLGWHPHCLCNKFTVLYTKDEFTNYLQGGDFDSRKRIRTIPQRAQKYLERNKKKIMGYKNKPYWLEDNFTNNFQLKKAILRRYVA